MAVNSNNSRDAAALTGEIHQITDLAGLHGSCTADNLRSPSVTGTNGRDDDIDLQTDYAESDVMLGGGGPPGPGNGSGNGSGSNGNGSGTGGPTNAGQSDGGNGA